MPGILKKVIVKRMIAALEASGASLLDSSFRSGRHLPWTTRVKLESGEERTYRVYTWSVSHGGRSRAAGEYRIQAKLPGGAGPLEFDRGITLLIGYQSLDPDVSNPAAFAHEVFVAWDPLRHLRVGASSSCQVPLAVLAEARISGVGWHMRRTQRGEEVVVAFRPEYLARYFGEAATGHAYLDPAAIKFAPPDKV